ncbi:Fe-S cluster assembly protein SufD [Leadbetterella sp. DM7]|uniref:Fe-S cluster assembly protein SufD n=1 Tax=Leadbetterella sp. DM7 TaxID=3235085 RepID=UPI00349E6B30
MSILTKIEGEFDSLLHHLNGKSGLAWNRLREQAFDNFKKLGIPTVKNEDWKYSSLKGLDKYDYQLSSASSVAAEELAALPFAALEGLQLVFVNGSFAADLSSPLLNEKIRVLSFREAENAIPEVLNEYYGKGLDIEKEGMTALNMAISRDGAVIYVPDHAVLEKPVVIRHIHAVGQGHISSSAHHLVVAGKNAEAKVVEIFQTIGDNSSFANMVTEIFVAEEARVDYYKIQDDNDAGFHVGTTQVLQKDRSYFYAATFTVNGGFVRNNLNLVLDGEYIESHMYGLYIPNGSQHVDNHTLVDHQKPNSESNELYKGILDGRSKGVFNGKIYVRQDAQKTNAYQNCRNVILSESAGMNTKPQLEIWADDVKCSHGTTTGKLDDDAVFYMQSRGIPRAEAIKLQLAAFAEDVVSQIKWEALRDQLDILILKKLQS